MKSARYGETAHLPPVSEWKIDPRTSSAKIEPVTDDRGFIMPLETAQRTIETFICDGYEWPYDPTGEVDIGTPNRHHGHWPEDHYRRRRFAKKGNNAGMPEEFREIRCFMSMEQRQLHNLIHDRTTPPKIPNFGHMEHAVRAHNALSQIARCAEEIIRIEADDPNVYDDSAVMNAYRQSTTRALGIGALRFLGLSYDGDFEDVHGAYAYLDSVAPWKMLDLTHAFPVRHIKPAGMAD